MESAPGKSSPVYLWTFATKTVGVKRRENGWWWCLAYWRADQNASVTACVAMQRKGKASVCSSQSLPGTLHLMDSSEPLNAPNLKFSNQRRRSSSEILRTNRLGQELEAVSVSPSGKAPSAIAAGVLFLAGPSCMAHPWVLSTAGCIDTSNGSDCRVPVRFSLTTSRWGPYLLVAMSTSVICRSFAPHAALYLPQGGRILRYHVECVQGADL